MMRPYSLTLATILTLASFACGIKGYSTFEPPKKSDQSSTGILANDELIKFEISAVCYSSDHGNIYISIFNKTDRPLMLENLLVKSDLRINAIDHRIPIVDVTVLDHERPGPYGNHMVPEWYESFEKIPTKFMVIESKSANSKERRFGFSLGYDRLGVPINKADSINTALDFDITVESSKRHYHLSHTLLKESHHYFWVLRDD